jgi:hypothetical protein
MPPDETLRPLYDYATAILQGVCRDRFDLGHLTSANGEIFLRARLAPRDLDDLAYADAYAGIRAVLARWGAIHQDGSGQPLRIRFNFHDPRSDDVEFQPAAAAASLAGAAPPDGSARGVARTKRRRTVG